MNPKKIGTLLFGILISATICFARPEPVGDSTAEKQPKPADTSSSHKLYVQFGLMYERNNHRTTNYRKGILVPVNTEVALVKKTKKTIVVALPGGNDLTIENIEPYSGETIDGIFARTFSTNKVDLSPFSDVEKKGITAGEVRVGMSKRAVVVAIGYPPKHKTPSLDSNQWRYWRNRFATFVVHFEDDKVSSIQE